jgi:hypothetical protein
VFAGDRLTCGDCDFGRGRAVEAPLELPCGVLALRAAPVFRGVTERAGGVCDRAVSRVDGGGGVVRRCAAEAGFRPLPEAACSKRARALRSAISCGDDAAFKPPWDDAEGAERAEAGCRGDWLCWWCC